MVAARELDDLDHLRIDGLQLRRFLGGRLLPAEQAAQPAETALDDVAVLRNGDRDRRDAGSRWSIRDRGRGRRLPQGNAVVALKAPGVVADVPAGLECVPLRVGAGQRHRAEKQGHRGAAAPTLARS